MKQPSKALVMLCALGALVLGFLTVSPAQAKDPGLVLASPTVAIYKSGSTYYGKVYATCKFGGAKYCTGKVWWKGDSGYARSYSLKPGQSAYLAVRMTTANQYNPWKSGNPVTQTTDQALYIDEAGPYNRSAVHDSLTRTIERKKSGLIHGTITGTGSTAAPTDLQATLFRIGRDQNTLVHTDYGTSFSFGVPLGTNNTPSGAYYLQVKGTDQDGQVRSWYWRGFDGQSRGGSKWFRDATQIKAGVDYEAPVTYGSISGTVSSTVGSGSGTAITVAAPPANYPVWSTDYYSILRELDIEACGNIFGETTASSTGYYAVGFLPSNPTGDEGYMVKAAKNASDSDGKPLMRLWNNKYRSCLAMIGYPETSTDYQNVNRSDPDLIALSSGNHSWPISMQVSKAVLKGKVSYSSTVYSADKTITIRERLPYRKILDSPVVYRGGVPASREFNVYNLPPGQYWVEIGRTTQCKHWVPSRYTNNDAYLQGEDRASESWKAFKHLYDLSATKEGIARAHGATDAQNHVVSGYAGWMWRDYCPSVHTGRYTWKTVGVDAAMDGGSVEVNGGNTLSISKGAWITGHVSRIDGKSNKEMLVTAYVSSGSNYGIIVPHYAITNGSGDFKITGLPSGTYKIRLNTDSWRGIGRNFTGTSGKSVSAGHGYSIGTLRALF